MPAVDGNHTWQHIEDVQHWYGEKHLHDVAVVPQYLQVVDHVPASF
jgi:hypothetical protein